MARAVGFGRPGRPFAQVSRTLEINGLTSVTKDAVETARESLIIGLPWCHSG